MAFKFAAHWVCQTSYFNCLEYTMF
jgi:hypothetical protein